MSFDVTLRDRTVERIDDADAYQQEGPITTFFLTRSDRQSIDAWSTRIASIRTSDVLLIRRVAEEVSFATRELRSA